MVWNKPRNVWQWLLLAVPALGGVIASEVARLWYPVPPLLDKAGHAFPNIGGMLMRDFWATVPTIFVLSLILCFAFFRGRNFFESLVAACMVAAVNCSVAIGGCAVVGLAESPR